MTIRVGCCGFPKSQAEYYQRFSLVEVQQTFYLPPKVATIQRWREQAPLGFRFAIKAWQLVTHEASAPTYRQPNLLLDGPKENYGLFQPTSQVMDAWERTKEAALALSASVVLFQSPPSFAPTEQNITNLVTFFQKAERAGLAFAWEPTVAWPEKVVWKLCQGLRLVYAQDPFASRPPTANGVVYFRMSGKSGYSYRYTDADLKQLAAWCAAYNTVYCLFNNVSMWDDALRLKEILGESEG
jgi:uncharacterized protein YecE (DUF72 family)